MGTSGVVDKQGTAIAALLKGMALFSLLSVSLTAPLGANVTDNKLIEGMQGQVSVFGVLSVAPCRLTMPSKYQHIYLGEFSTRELSKPFDETEAKRVVLNLNDCLIDQGSTQNFQPAKRNFAYGQPMVHVRLTALSDPDLPELIQVSGAQGIGLRIRDAQSRTIMPGVWSSAQLLLPGDNQLVFQVSLQRTDEVFLPGVFAAAVNVELDYE